MAHGEFLGQQSTWDQVIAWCVTWNNFNLSSKVFCGIKGVLLIHMRAISQVLMNLIYVFIDSRFKIMTVSPRGQWVNKIEIEHLN